VPRAGYKAVGDKPLKLLTVHVVDKGKPWRSMFRECGPEASGAGGAP
jgi:hypothetical protein